MGEKSLRENRAITHLQDLSQLTYDVESMKVNLPKLAEGEISIVGTNALSIIDLNGNVFQPLQDKQVKVTLKQEVAGEIYEKEFTINVSGKYSDEGDNEKPFVIPALAEWYGLRGKINLKKKIGIHLEQEQFKDASDLFFEDLAYIGYQPFLSDTKELAQITFVYDDCAGYAKEGYGITIKNEQIIIYAEQHIGAFYATRSLLQMIKSGEDGVLNNGYIRDYPKYEVRGFMLDVGRKFVRLDYLYEIMKTLSYYKINDFQIHLNDNAIFLESYKDAKDVLNRAYTAFRLESNLEGNGHYLTAQDGHYTKSEFRDLILYSKMFGIDIVPEFDTPGHAMSFVKVRPDLMYQGEIMNGKPDQERASMLNLDKEETYSLVKEVYNEYLDGENPVITDVPIHLGCDEYYGEAEVFRSYINTLLKFIRDEKGLVPRVWGSLTDKAGETYVTSKGVQLSLWNTDWADPKQMLEEGYDLINIEDEQVYMVPGADYYQDYLNTRKIFEDYTPNKFLNGTNLSESHPQLLGGGFALWNDQIDVKENGITSFDMFDRLFDALPFVAQKLWGSKTADPYETFASKINMSLYAPNTNPTFAVKELIDSPIQFNFETEDVSTSMEGHLVTFDEGACFNGYDSYLKTGYDVIGINSQLEMKFMLNRTDKKQVLLETDDYGMVYIDDGYISYVFEGNYYRYNYQLKHSEQYTIKLYTKLHETKLFINEKEIYLTEDTKKEYNTLLIPFQRIGAKQDAIDGKIYSVRLFHQKEL